MTDDLDYDNMSEEQLRAIAGATPHEPSRDLDYDNMSEEQLRAIAGSQPAAQSKEPQSWGDWLKQTYVAGARGMRESLPFAKDVSAAARAVGNPLTREWGSGDFTKEKKFVEHQQELAREEAPVTTAAGEIGGYFVPWLGLAGRAAKAEQAVASKLAPKVGETAANVIAGGATGAGLGAIQGLGTGTDLGERLGNAATVGGVGAVGGAALPAVGAGVSGAARKLLNVGSPLTEAELAGRKIGVNLPRFLGSEGETLPRMAEHLGAMPLIGAPIRRAGAEAVEKTGEAFKNIPGINAEMTRADAGQTAKTSLHNWISDISAKKADEAYAAVEKHINPSVKTELTNTREVAQTLMDRLKEANLPEESEAIRMVLNAATNPEGLTYSGIRTLRTKVREKIKQNILGGDLSQGELKQLKTALNKDLELAAGNAGGERGITAYKRADAIYGGIKARRENLEKIIGKDPSSTSATSVFDRLTRMATDKSGNPERLTLARKSMSPSEWSDVTSGVVNHMGRDAENNFSPLRFLTEYGKMSNKGRDVLFGPVGNPVRDAVEDFRKVSTQFKNASKHKNWSGTAHTAAGMAGIYEAFHNPLEAAGYAAPIFPLALILASPKSARQFSTFLRNPSKKAYDSLMTLARSGSGHSAESSATAQDAREERASGGKVDKRDYPARRLTRLEKAAKKAREALALESKPLMEMPDEQVANALRIAEKK